MSVSEDEQFATVLLSLGTPRHRCIHCQTSFDDPLAFCRHVTLGCPHQCPVCYYITPGFPSMVQHMTIHRAYATWQQPMLF